MFIASLSFIVFVTAIFLVYHFLPLRWQNIWLLIASYYFCITWSWFVAATLLLATVVNYILAFQVRKNEKPQRYWLWGSICFNVALLLFFRSYNFFLTDAEQFANSLGLDISTGGLSLLIPLGLSYYTLENISYLIDVYRGQITAVANPITFSLYLAYFPKLVAGPIERAREFIPKLEQPRQVGNQLFSRSIGFLALGLTRKLFIADTLNTFVPWDAFAAPGNLASVELFGWIVVYAFILYNDFVGYTNIVRGFSGLLGLELSANFQQPYFARTFTEFWNRWHITLSHWLRDYIYLPLLRSLLRRNPSRHNLLNLILPPIATMIVSGLWHGLSGHMILWGLLHGLYQIGERLPSLWRPIVPPQRRPLWRQTLSAGVVFLLVALAWLPFRFDVKTSVDLLVELVSPPYAGFTYRRIFLAPFFILLSLGLDSFQQWAQVEIPFLRWPRWSQAAILATVLFIVWLSLTNTQPPEPFIYRGF